MTDTPLVVESISYTTRDKKVLTDISLETKKGELIGLIGPNGVGKSTLLKIMSGLIKPTHGKITILQEDLHALQEKRLAQRLAYMPQSTYVNFSFTAEQIVLMGRHPYLKRWEKESQKDYEIMEQAFEYVGISHLKNRYIHSLSGGERQLVFFARAVTQQTPILLLDEPTSDLDIGHQVKLMDLVSDFVQKGHTVIAAIHDLNLAARYCHRILLLHNGKTEIFSTPERVLTRDRLEHVYKTNIHLYTDPFLNKPTIIPYSS